MLNPTKLAESGLVPDRLLRMGIRWQLEKRLEQEGIDDLGSSEERRRYFREALRQSAMTINTVDANRQHYEVPAAFFELMLGERLKYSSCLWQEGCTSLNQAERDMLAHYAQRAQLENGQRILDMGCGWGSFTLWAAEQYPDSRITAVSNSTGQRQFIEAQAASKGLTNIEVITGDIEELELSGRFDRLVTVEMMEHVRNYQALLKKVAGWLEPDGLMFVHIFCHAQLHYPFDEGWMTEHFFSGGQMPAFDTLMHFTDDMRIADSWRVSGQHYAKTLEAWLDKLDAQRRQALEILRDAPDPKVQLQRWRMFLMACAELFACNKGREWFVGHYLLTPGRAVD